MTDQFKAKKPLLRRPIFHILVTFPVSIFILLLIIAAFNMPKDALKEQTTDTPKNSAIEQTTETTGSTDYEQVSEEETLEPELSMENFKKIKNGMTQAEVEAMIGEGELVSSAGEGEYLTEAYSYTKGGLANISITYQGGKVMGKAQFGL